MEIKKNAYSPLKNNSKIYMEELSPNKPEIEYFRVYDIGNKNFSNKSSNRAKSKNAQDLNERLYTYEDEKMDTANSIKNKLIINFDNKSIFL